MSEKTEIVEITIRVPKKLMDIVEAENYLGWKRDDFFEAAVRSMVGITIRNMLFEDMGKFQDTYGKDLDVFYLRSTRVVDC